MKQRRRSDAPATDRWIRVRLRTYEATRPAASSVTRIAWPSGPMVVYTPATSSGV
jgi:hypothetical protein